MTSTPVEKGGLTKCRRSKGGCVDLVLWILPKCRQGGGGGPEFRKLCRRHLSMAPKKTCPLPCFRRNPVVEDGPDEPAAHEGEEDLQAEDELHHAGARHDGAQDRSDCGDNARRCVWVRRSVTYSENITNNSRLQGEVGRDCRLDKSNEVT